MAVRNSTARTTKNYLSVTYEGQNFMLTLGDFQTKSILYSTKKKLINGKIDIPNMENPKNLSCIQITCTKGEPLKFNYI